MKPMVMRIASPRFSSMMTLAHGMPTRENRIVSTNHEGGEDVGLLELTP
jgi:hypothetical protein